MSIKVSRRLVELLKRMRVTYASLDDSTVTVHLEYVPLPKSRVKIVEHEPEVGSWFKEADRNVIRIDNDIKRRNWLLSLAVHEAVEKWIKNTFFPAVSVEDVYPYPIHTIAEEIERKWHCSRFGVKSWKEYCKHVEDVWEKENKKVNVL
jgi:hypothetical protein